MDTAERNRLMDEREDLTRRMDVVGEALCCFPYDNPGDDVAQAFLESRLRQLHGKREDIERQFPECRLWPGNDTEG